jgi:NitT/TauT family transport system permease protein/putative hydroxymethylpyrimidine transport system permease protein
MSKVALPVLMAAVLLGAWEALAQTGALADILGINSSASDVLVPAPSDVASTLWQDRELLKDDGWVTLREILAGFGIAVAIGVALAVAMHLSEALRRLLYPMLVASQTVPVIAIAPVLVIWLGYGIGPKLAVIALVCFFPVTVNTLDGLRSVDQDAIRMMRTLDAGRWATLRRLELPTALPYFFSGAKVAVAIAAIGAVFGEWVGSDDGLGHLMLTAQSQLLTDRVFAAIVVLSSFALLLFGLIALLERRFAWWGRERARN